ncbi:MAG: hypothetical protein OEM24_04925 [Paracoccaceae bacterium]|nr:hypothetical protein [Paracoccaceae bacterium]
MSARAGIAEILARARAAAVPAARRERVLAADGHAARRAAIFAEIDETMLARALGFRLGEARLTVEARSRRALQVTHFEPADGRAAEIRARLDGGGLPPDEECALLAELVHLFAEAEGDLTVLSEPSELAPGVVEKGHAAAELAAAAPELAAPAPAAAPKPKKAAAGAADSALRGFHETCAGFARAGALVSAEGKLRAGHGDDSAARLAQLLARERAAPGPFLEAAIPGPKLVFLGRKDGAGRSLCFAAEGEETAVAEIAATDLGAALEAWRAAHG